MLQLPAVVVVVGPGAVTVIVFVVAGAVVGTSQRFTTGFGVAAARRANPTETQKKVVAVRENML